MTAKEQLKPGETIPGTPYRVIRLIGSGGMGSVYEVEHQELGKRFVLKTLLSELSNRADLVQRLRTEWRSLGKLEHPNIVRVSDAGVAQGKFPYFVMERLMGETLADRLAQQRKLPVELALKISIGVLDALSVAHSIGIIHRDVKPPNIFVTDQEVPKLLDFGIAKLLDASAEAITARGVAVGTPRYMSPEQAAGDPVDARADLYAVGLVLYEMISGAGPYRASDANELFLAHLTQPAPPLSSQAPRVSLELDAITASLLAKSPTARPASAKAAAQALRAALALYQKPGATPLLSAPGKREPVAIAAVNEPTAALSEATTRQGDVKQQMEATTKRFDPKAVAATDQGPTITDPANSEQLGVTTVDERVGSDRRRSEPPASGAGSTQHVGRRSDRPAPGWWSAETRTAAVAPVAAVELGATPPPVTRAAANEAYRRWLFPAVVVLLALIAVVLSRWNSAAQHPQATQSASPVQAAPAPRPPVPVAKPPVEATPIAPPAAVPSAANSESASPARSLKAAPNRQSVNAAPKPKTAKEPAPEPELALPPATFKAEPPKNTRKVPPATPGEASHPALPPSGL